jgi:hypothetical protein
MMRKIFASAGALALLLMVGVARPSSAQGMPSDKPIYFTFSQPVALPGKTLPAGKYLFKLMNSQVNRTIVQVFNADGTQLQATFFTVAAERMDRPNDPEVRFMEGSETGPAAIRTYWYPGERRGWEFIYPRSEAMRLAKAATAPVLTTTEDVSGDQMKDAPLARVGANGDQTTYDANGQPVATAASGRAISGSQDTVTTAPATTPAPRQPVTQPDITPSTPPAPATTPATRAATPSDRDALPQTASALPAVVLAGVVALAAALVLRRTRRVA